MLPSVSLSFPISSWLCSSSRGRRNKDLFPSLFLSLLFFYILFSSVQRCSGGLISALKLYRRQGWLLSLNTRQFLVLKMQGGQYLHFKNTFKVKHSAMCRVFCITSALFYLSKNIVWPFSKQLQSACITEIMHFTTDRSIDR